MLSGTAEKSAAKVWNSIQRAGPTHDFLLGVADSREPNIRAEEGVLRQLILLTFAVLKLVEENIAICLTDCVSGEL